MNRVFDSSGPEGKVRGTPQQIIDKYNQLTHDARLGDDRVAAENFQQHSEHYTRMLSAAQREMDVRREQQEREHRERQQQRNEHRQDQGADQQHDTRRDNVDVADPAQTDQPEILAGPAESGSGLVETPESQPKSSVPRARKPRPKPEFTVPASDQADSSEAAE